MYSIIWVSSKYLWFLCLRFMEKNNNDQDLKSLFGKMVEKYQSTEQCELYIQKNKQHEVAICIFKSIHTKRREDSMKHSISGGLRRRPAPNNRKAQCFPTPVGRTFPKLSSNQQWHTPKDQRFVWNRKAVLKAYKNKRKIFF